MSLARLIKLGLVILITGGMLVIAGCNEDPDFDLDKLFSIEDFARDADYVNSFLDMMMRMRKEHDITVSYLGGTEGAVNFDEILPDGWKEPDATLLPGWYKRTAADASDEFIRFDYNVSAPEDISPVKSEYYKFRLDTSIVGVTVAFGDSFAVIYDDNYRNISRLNGSAVYIDTKVLYWSGAGEAVQTSGRAGMFNLWRAELTGISAQPGNLAGDIVIEGITVIDDLSDRVEVNVKIEATMRVNASGEAVIWVEGRKRAEVDFSGFGTYYHGSVKMAFDNFSQDYYF